MNLTEQLKRDGHLLTKSAPPKKTKKRLNRVSKKREGANREYLKLRKEFLGVHPLCGAWNIILDWAIDTGDTALLENIPGRRPRSSEIHHRRKPKATYLNDTTTWIAVSKWAHRWIEQHKNLARQLGLLENV